MQRIINAVPAALAFQEHIIDLSSQAWVLSSHAHNLSVPAKVPSNAHLNLLAAGIIEDPLRNLNEFDQRWIAFSNWTYTSQPIDDLRTADSTWLRFDGLDTFTAIYFCGERVANTDNQFRQYLFDITDILAECSAGDRTLRLEFGSAPVIANATASAPGQQTFPDGLQFIYEFDNAYYIRKEQSDFGWDWGPALAPAGPWQPLYVIQLGSDAVHVHNSAIDIYREGQLPLIPPDQNADWILNASLDYTGRLPNNARLSYRLTDNDNGLILQGSLYKTNRTKHSITGKTTISKHEVDLWWPNGLGHQKLYNLTISIESSGTSISSLTKQVGFRTIVLDMSPISELQISQGVAPGNNWKFEINGHEFYALGSNLIPPDPFWPTVTQDRMSRLFDSVIAGNQNMLRVWSSGAYLPDFIYDLADERGILLWSEFQFSDHLYPTTTAFLDNVREEAVYNVRRLNHHPSLALWAGGNELESLILQNIVKSKAPELYDHYVGEFEKLFIDVLAPAVFSNSRSISYTPSSTGRGWLTLNFDGDPLRPFTERYLNVTEGHIYGDTDFYNYDPVILGAYDKYPIGRFSNEFGFLSMPSVQSWSQQVSRDQLYFRSPVTTLRCHHNVAAGLNTSNFDAANVGYDQMIAAVSRWYPVPHKSDNISQLSAWAYVTQVFQAELYKSQIHFYRRGSGMPERQLGSLYWQLEDQWVAPTWAGIEYNGRWKMLHSVAQDSFQPAIISPFYNASTNELAVYVTSSLWEELSGQASFEWFDWSGRRLVSPEIRSWVVGPLNTTLVLSMRLSETTLGVHLKDAVLHTNISAQGRLPNAAKESLFQHESWFHAIPLKDSALVEPGLQLTHDQDTQSFSVTATTGIAAWVWLEYPVEILVTFESNGFWLGAGQTRNIGYRLIVGTEDAWMSAVMVKSMWDLTHERSHCIGYVCT